MAAKPASKITKQSSRKAKLPARKAKPPPRKAEKSKKQDDAESRGVPLSVRPPSVSVAIAARDALRVLPALVLEFDAQGLRGPEEVAAAHVLPAFRATAVAWVAAEFPIHGKELVVAATFAADFDATVNRADAAFYAADVARGAATTAAAAATDAGLAGEVAAVAAGGAVASISYEAATVADAARADDITAVAAGLTAADLASRPLWPEGPPQRFVELWQELGDRLRSLDEGWDVWTDWYEARLEGRPADEALEVARVTIADEIWKQGPRTVNAHIRELIDSPPDPVPRPPPAASPQLRRNVWLAQFKLDLRLSLWTDKVGPGSEIPWNIGKADIAAMRAGDPVVYWRTITKGRDRGGIAGTGRVTSADPTTDDFGAPSIRTEVVEFFDDAPLGRDEVIAETGLNPSHWQFKFYQLPADVAAKMDALLRAKERKGIVDDEHQAGPSRSRHETEYVSDRPETARDLLGRAPLAFALAAQINRIWDAQTKGEVRPGRWRRLCDALHITRVARPSSQQDEAAFILHIDAPWGGGKTTFANFIGRILNPAAFDLDASAEGIAFLEGLPLDDDALWKPKYRKRRWHVVQFNAWQHEHVSPPWWNFYEAIRVQCLKGLVRSRSAASLKNTAPWRRIPVGAWNWLQGRARWLCYVLREVAWRIWSPATRRAVVTTLLLGVVAFFVYWTGLYGWLETLEIGGVKATTVATAIASGGIGVLIFGAVRSGLSTFVESLSSSADAASLGEADPLYRFQTHFLWFVRQLDEPVLVIVDDIDRCKPEYVVELVRGLLTIFRSPRVVFLLLGDKTWIEQAFAHVHADMAKAHTDARISFGGRFAEKAIQLSFILPEANKEERKDYLVAVLTGKLPIAGTGEGTIKAGEGGTQDDDEAPARRQAEKLSRQLDEFGQTVRQRFAGTRDTEELVRAKTDTREEIEQLFTGTGNGTSDELAKRFQQAAHRTVEVEASYRSSTSEQSEEDIRHGVEPVAPFLPGNPRRIKRIVNMVSAFQESGQIAEKIDPLSRKWRQLVLWTMVMSEYPQVWRTLVLDEAVARDVVGLVGEADKDGIVKVPPLAKRASEAEKTHRAKVAEIASEKGVIQLLRGDPFNEAIPGDKDHAIDEDTLVWLRRLTPLS